MNGMFWYYGYDEEVKLTDGSSATFGTARTDLNAYTITLLDVSRELPYEIESSAMDAIINPVTP